MRETVNEDFVLLGGTELTQCEECVYLGGVVSADGFCDRDVDRRIGMAAGIIRNLHSIWNNNITIYKAHNVRKKLNLRRGI